MDKVPWNFFLVAIPCIFISITGRYWLHRMLYLTFLLLNIRILLLREEKTWRSSFRFSLFPFPSLPSRVSICVCLALGHTYQGCRSNSVLSSLNGTTDHTQNLIKIPKVFNSRYMPQQPNKMKICRCWDCKTFFQTSLAAQAVCWHPYILLRHFAKFMGIHEDMILELFQGSNWCSAHARRIVYCKYFTNLGANACFMTIIIT